MRNVIDRLASAWLNWRTSKIAEKNGFKDPELLDIEIKRGITEIVMNHDTIAYLAGEAAAILSEADAKNYVQFDMQPRIDQHIRPIRVTVQWRDGEAPAEKAARLEKELERALWFWKGRVETFEKWGHQKQHEGKLIGELENEFFCIIANGFPTPDWKYNG